MHKSSTYPTERKLSGNFVEGKAILRLLWGLFT